MTVGNSDTFFDADWNKLPFFIEARVDGRMIGKSQILSVPVAEYAKQTDILTKDILCSKKWKYVDSVYGYEESVFSFAKDGKCLMRYIEDDNYSGMYKGQYEIEA